MGSPLWKRGSEGILSKFLTQLGYAINCNVSCQDTPALPASYLKYVSTMQFNPVTRGAIDGMLDRLPNTTLMICLFFTFRSI